MSLNLKEGFRYQNFMNDLLKQVEENLTNPKTCLKITKVCYKNKSNPEAQDVTEIQESDEGYSCNDLINFLVYLKHEKEKLTESIEEAKNGLDFCISSAIEGNKYRHSIIDTLTRVGNMVKPKTTIQEKGFKLNVEGNQVPYFYDADIICEPAYDAEKTKRLLTSLKTEADSVSAEIESAYINTKIDYIPRFNINEGFDAIISDFISSKR